MGSCIISSKPDNSPSNQMIIKTEVSTPNSFEAKVITQSYFYHLIRKQIHSRLNSTPSKIQFINISQQSNIYPSSKLTSDQITKQLKIIYNLKTLIFIDSKTKKTELSPDLNNILNKFVELNIKPSSVLIITKIKSFKIDYPLFLDDNQFAQKKQSAIRNMNLPLLIFDSKDVASNSSTKQLVIYLHNLTLYKDNLSKNPSFYQQYYKIKKEQIVDITQKNNLGNFSKQSDHKHILIIHLSSQEIKELSKQMIRQLSQVYAIDPYNLTCYLAERIPFISQQTRSMTSIPLPFIPQKKRQIKSSKQLGFQPEDKKTQFKRLLLDYYNECKSLVLTEEIFKLLCRLLQNLTKTIKPNKSQFSEKLFKYSSGFSLLESIGFKKKGDEYYCSLENKYLKIFKIDLPLAYRLMKDEVT